MSTIRTPRQIQGGYPAATRGLNFFDLDTDLQRLLGKLAPDLLPHYGARLSAFGAWVGGPLDAQADYTNRHAPPRLETHDNDGNPLGRVVNNPLYLECHREAYRRGAIGLAFGENAAPHLFSFACGYLLSSADVSIHCPVTMTGAVAYVLERLAPAAVRDAYLPDLVRLDGQAKSAGTWATEQHGGSDVGATTTRAEPAGDGWRLTGLKWFTSNAGSELALATARPAGAPRRRQGLGLLHRADDPRRRQRQHRVGAAAEGQAGHARPGDRRDRARRRLGGRGRGPARRPEMHDGGAGIQPYP